MGVASGLAIAESFAKKVAEQREQNAEYYTYENHRSHGKVETEVFFFDMDVARQAAQPAQAVAEQPEYQPGQQ